MNAWRVKLNDCDTVYVLAETGAKATAAAIAELAAPYRARWGDAEPARPVIVGGRCERCRERGAPCTG